MMAYLSQGQQTSAIYWLVNSEPYKAVFNDPTDPDYVGGLGGDQDGITGLDAPELRENAVNIVESHGGMHGNFWAGRRPVTLNAQINPNVASTVASREDVLERLRRASNLYTADGTLVWFPGDPNIVATTRVNLLLDPSFEYDVSGNTPNQVQNGETGYGFLPSRAWWDNSAAQWTSRTFLVNSGFGWANKKGNNSLHIVGTKDNNATARNIGCTSLQFGPTLGQTIPVVAGRVYSAKVEANIQDAAATGGPGLRMDLFFLDGNGGQVGSTVSSNTVAVATTGAQTLTINGATAPAGAVSARIDVFASSTTALDVVDFYLDGFQLVQEATAGAYFDGDSANCSWLGLQGFGQSVNRPNARFITVRRQQPLRISGLGMSKQALISLVAADPRIYSTVQYRAQVAHATDLNGLENKGDVESPALYRVYGPYSAGTVDITHTAYAVGRHQKWTKQASPEGTSGHYVQADDYLRTLLLDPTGYANGTGTNEYGALDFSTSVWPGFMPGPANRVRFDCSGGGTTANTVLDVRWRDAWM